MSISPKQNNDYDDDEDELNEYEYQPFCLGLCGRAGSGKTTVESLICPEILYKTKVVKNRLDYIVKICKGQISKERLLELINEKIEPNYGEKLNINGKYTVWTRDWSNLNQNMYNGLSFAEPLKIICAIIFDLDFQILNGQDSEKRDRRHKLQTREFGHCGKLKGRRCLEYFGTDIIRNLVKDNFWLTITQTRVRNLMKRGYSVCVSDTRFENEYQMLKREFSATIWIIYRSDKDLILDEETKGTHVSNWSFLQVIDQEQDIPFKNDGSIEDLKTKIYGHLQWSL